MKDENKSKEQLLDELAKLQQRIAEQKKSKAKLKHTEKASLNSEFLSSTLISNVPIGLGLASLDGRILYSNDRIRLITGYSGEELNQINLKDTYQNPKDRSLLLKQLKKKGFVRNFEAGLKRKDGTPYYASLTITPITLNGENVILTVCEDISERKLAEEELRKHRDHFEEQVKERTAELKLANEQLQKEITEHKEAQEKLKESEQKYRDIVELAPDGIITTDLKGKITSCNTSLSKRTGFPKEKFINKHFSKIPTIRAQDIPKYMKAMNSLLRGKMPKSIEYEWIHKDGTTHIGEIHMSLMKRKGKIKGLQAISRDITERKQIKETLVKSEEKYRGLVEKSGAGIATTDMKGKFTYVNKALCKMIGYSKEELMGMPFSQFLHPDDKKTILKQFRNAWRFPKKELDLEFRVIHKKGHTVYCYSRPTVYMYKNKIAGFHAIITDITQLKQTEERTKESEGKFRNLAEQSPNMIFINKKGRVVYANKKCEEITGYKKKEFYSPDFNFRCLMAPESLEKVKSAFARHIKGKEVKPYEYTLITNDGKRIETIHNTKLIDYEGEKAILGIETDITERKRIEEALQESEEKYRNVVEQANDGIAIIQDRVLKYVNPQMAEINSYTVKELIGTPFTKYIHPDELSKAANYYKRRMEGKEVPSRYESALIDKKGHKIFVELNAGIITYQGKPADLVIVRDITDRKKAEEALLASEAFNFALFQYNPMEIIVVDHAGKIIKTNLARRKSGKRWPNIGDMMYKDYAGKHEIDMYAELMECMRTKKIKRFHEMKYGDKFLSMIIAPFPMGAIIISQDVTDRKQAEKALQESEEKYRRIVETAYEGILVTDAESKIVFPSQRIAEMLGYTEDEMTGKPILAFMDKEWKAAAKASVKHRLQDVIEKRDFKFRRKDGTELWAILTTNSFFDKEGRYAGALEMVTDITERKQAEEELRKSEKKYRDLVENINDVIYTVDSNGVMTYISPAIEAITGYSPSEIIGRSFTEFVNKEDLPHMMENFRKPLSGQTVSGEYRITTKSDESRWLQTSTQPIFVGNHVIGSQGMLMDITERKLADEQIKASLREKEILLQEIHHRVKNNMQVISSILNLQSRNITDDQVLEIFKSSQDRVKSMALIHERLYQSKDFARVDFAEYVQSLTSHLFSSYGIPSEVVKLNMNIKDVSLNINTAIPCGLIINELISNSLKHGFPDKRKGEIKIAMHPLKEKKIELIVSDTGIGLPEELNIRKTKSLGLRLVTLLAEDQLHGKIQLDRTCGTRYIIKLELKR